MKKAYLKPESGVWFYLQYMVYLQWIWWEWEKKTRKYIYMKKQGKNSPFGCPPITPYIKLEADCFPVRKNRKQAGPTLGGTGILIYRDKRNKGSGAVWVDRSR